MFARRAVVAGLIIVVVTSIGGSDGGGDVVDDRAVPSSSIGGERHDNIFSTAAYFSSGEGAGNDILPGSVLEAGWPATTHTHNLSLGGR